jgi:hypothetical protein
MKSIPAWAKRTARHNQQGLCSTCSEPLPLGNFHVRYDTDGYVVFARHEDCCSVPVIEGAAIPSLLRMAMARRVVHALR